MFAKTKFSVSNSVRRLWATALKNIERDDNIIILKGHTNKSYQSVQRDIFPFHNKSVVIPLLFSHQHFYAVKKLAVNRFYCTKTAKTKMVSNKCLLIFSFLVFLFNLGLSSI